MDAFFVRHIQVPRVFLSCGYPVEFFGDHRSKTKFAKDFPNVICITNCKPRYSKSELKNVFRIMSITLLSVNAKIGSPVCYSGDFFFIPVSSLKVFGHSIHSERRRIYLGKSIQALQNDTIIISWVFSFRVIQPTVRWHQNFLCLFSSILVHHKNFSRQSVIKVPNQ